MTNRCTALLDFKEDKAIRCKLERGHKGVHKTNGWEKAVGSTGVLVKVLMKKAAAR